MVYYNTYLCHKNSMSNKKLEENIHPAETIKRLSNIAIYKLRKPHTWDVVSTMQQRIVELLD